MTIEIITLIIMTIIGTASVKATYDTAKVIPPENKQVQQQVIETKGTLNEQQLHTNPD